VINGNPNGAGLPEWPAVEAGKAETMELGSDIRVIPVASEEKIDFFKNK
jgi:para-nitrobenzyl esterase